MQPVRQGVVSTCALWRADCPLAIALDQRQSNDDVPTMRQCGSDEFLTTQLAPAQRLYPYVCVKLHTGRNKQGAAVNEIAFKVSHHRNRHHASDACHASFASNAPPDMNLIRLHKCKRCGKAWFLRKPGTPKICPTCKTTYWHTPREVKTRRFA